MERDPIVVVGGVVAGTAAAAAARREAPPDVPVILLERSPYVAYVSSSLPYEIRDQLDDLERVVLTTPAELRGESGVELRVGHEAVGLDIRRRRLFVRHLAEEREYPIDYGSIVLATGARIDTSALLGTDTEGVFAPRQLQDAILLRRYLEERRPRSALVVGGGKTGFAFAESLRHLGLDVLIIERGRDVVWELGRIASAEMREAAARHGIAVRTDTEARAFFRAGDRVIAHTTQEERLSAEVVVLATGLVPETSLATSAGIALGRSGAIEVDHRMRTSAHRVFACGECAEAFDRVSRRHRFHPVPTTAFQQGDVAGANAAGAHRAFAGVVGTQALRFFDVEAARTGLPRQAVEALGDDVLAVESTQATVGHPFASSGGVSTQLYVERGTGRLLAAEMVGRGTVAKRVDVFATALAAKMRVDEIASLDLTWAPPIAPILDPVLVGARAARERSARDFDGDGEAFGPDA